MNNFLLDIMVIYPLVILPRPSSTHSPICTHTLVSFCGANFIREDFFPHFIISSLSNHCLYKSSSMRFFVFVVVVLLLFKLSPVFYLGNFFSAFILFVVIVIFLFPPFIIVVGIVILLGPKREFGVQWFDAFTSHNLVLFYSDPLLLLRICECERSRLVCACLCAVDEFILSHEV